MIEITQEQLKEMKISIEAILNRPKDGDCVYCKHEAHDICACGCKDYD